MGMPWWHSVLSPLYHHRNSCSKEWIREKESERESGSRCPVNCGSKRAMLVPISSRYNPLLANTIAQNELGEYGEINSTPLFGKFWIVAVNWVAPNSTHVENKPFWKEWCGGETRKELGKQWPRKKNLITSIFCSLVSPDIANRVGYFCPPLFLSSFLRLRSVSPLLKLQTRMCSLKGILFSPLTLEAELSELAQLCVVHLANFLKGSKASSIVL